MQVRLELQHCQTTDRRSMRGRGHARSIPEDSFELAIGPGYAVLGAEITTVSTCQSRFAKSVVRNQVAALIQPSRPG